MNKQTLNAKNVIAIDGYSSTGKSSFAKLIAFRLNYLHIDTGAIYRAITWHAMNLDLIHNTSEIDTEELYKSLKTISIIFKKDEQQKLQIYINNINIDKEIRTLKVSNSVSHIAALGPIREFTNKILYNLNKEHNLVVDGRDMGTTVFPNATLKIFMTASLEIRAQRRLNELKAKGENVSLEDVQNNIINRDKIDETRKISPLKQAEDAIVLDNSHMSMDEELDWIFKIIKERNI